MFTWLESLLSDLRHAARTLRRSPTFAFVAILSLGLGVGANTAIFTLINAVLLDSLPVSRPEQLVRVTMGGERRVFTNPLWEAIRDRQDILSSAFAFSANRQVFDLARGGEVRRVAGAWVSGDFFAALGVRPAAGRLIARDDDFRGCPGVAVVSHGLWQREYGGASDVVGRSIMLDGHPFEIVGVSDPAFYGVEVGRSPQVYAPLCAEAVLRGQESQLDDRGSRFLGIIGRLKEGITLTEARARLGHLSAGILATTLPPGVSAEFSSEYLNRTLDVETVARGVSDLREGYRTSLIVLMALVGVVLLIACANVANLLLTRATTRQREMAIRLAIGAGRGRLVRQLLTESLLLSMIGAALALALAPWGSALLVSFLSTRTNIVSLDLSLDARVLAFTIVIATTTGVLFGLAPAWRATRVAPHAAMKAGGRGLAEGHSQLTVLKALLVGQIALSLVLVVTAGLLLGTFRTLATLDPGFRPEGVLLVRADLRNSGFARDANSADDVSRRARADILERLRSIPGVRAASASRLTPLSGGGWNRDLIVSGFTPADPRDATVWANAVSDGFFSTVGTAMLAGRDFGEVDTRASPRVVIINERLARKFFDTVRPLGRQLRVRRGEDLSPPFEVVGIVEDARYETLREDAPPTVYFPLAQLQDVIGSPVLEPHFQVRANTAPMALISSIKTAIGLVDPGISLEFVALSDQVAGSLRRERLLATLSGFFGGLALLLAVVGLYGTVAYSIARRRKEIGIRIALGGARSRVVRLVLTEVGRIAAAGIALGAIGALATSRWVASFLYGVTPTDPMTLTLSALTLAVAALLAGAVPAWRAAQLNPMVTLREE